MSNQDLAVTKKHVFWALTKVSANLNAELADEVDSNELYAMEKYLRDALRAIARLEEIE